MAKTTTSLAIWGDNPPYYHNEVLENLEEISNTNTLTTKGLEKNFGNISQTLNNASDKLASTIQEQAEKSRIQQAIEAERLQNGISEMNYNLLDATSSIDELNDTTWRSAEMITKSIDDFSDRVVDRLNITNDKLNDIDIQLDIANASLKMISSHLVDLIKMIAKPNETEALELADQARQNIALDKKDRALGATRKALEMSNGTSITVLAYHILTLSLFKDDDSVAELLKSYEDFVNLVSFKISDKQSDKEIITKEVDSVVFPVMSVMGYYYRDLVMQSTQKMYTALYQVRSRLSNTLRKPLMSKNALGMISHPNFLREMHWSLLLTKYVIPEKQIKYYVNYILYLANSNVLIKNELAILATKHFYEEGFLYAVLVDILDGNNNEDIHNAIKIIISILPQDVISLDDKTLWALKLYVKKYNLKTNQLLEEEIKEAIENIYSSIKRSYIIPFEKTQQEIDCKELEIKTEIKTIEKEREEVSRKEMKRLGEHNKAIDDKQYEERIKGCRSTIAKDRPSSIKTVMIWLGILLLVVVWSKNFYPNLTFMDEYGRVAHGTGTPLLFQLVWYVPLLAIMMIIGGFIGNSIGEAIDRINLSIYRKSTERANNDILNYQYELSKKYNINQKKQKIEAPYFKKISNLRIELQTFNKNKKDDLVSRLNSLVEEYAPPHTEQLSKTKDELKKLIEKKMFGSFADFKIPSDLKM